MLENEQQVSMLKALLHDARQERDALKAEVARLRAALEPFAARIAGIAPHCSNTDVLMISVGICRAAAAALQPLPAKDSP